MKPLKIESTVIKKDNKIWMELPDNMEYLVNHKVRLSLTDFHDEYSKVKDIFNIITAKTDELPEDYSTNFEHYNCGKPKRENEE